MIEPPHWPIVTIDGPLGAGKTTTASLLAKSMQWTALKSGAFFRAVAAECLRRDQIEMRPEAISNIGQAVYDEFVHHGGSGRVPSSPLQHTWAVDEIVVGISAITEIRILWKAWLRSFRPTGGGLIVDGRSMGSEVFPDADLKFWLDASSEVRTTRRLREYSRSNTDLGSLLRRDAMDVEDGRLILPQGAVRIDSTSMSQELVVHRMTSYMSKKGLFPIRTEFEGGALGRPSPGRGEGGRDEVR